MTAVIVGWVLICAILIPLEVSALIYDRRNIRRLREERAKLRQMLQEIRREEQRQKADLS